VSEWKVYIPPGNWVHLWTDKSYTGPVGVIYVYKLHNIVMYMT